MAPLVVCGTAYHLTPLLTDFETLLIFSLVYGILNTAFWALQTLIVIEFLGLEFLAPALGFYAVFIGLSSSISFPLGGSLKDMTGTYSSTFHYYGFLYMIASFALIYIRYTRKRHAARSLSVACDVNKHD